MTLVFEVFKLLTEEEHDVRDGAGPLTLKHHAIVDGLGRYPHGQYPGKASKVSLQGCGLLWWRHRTAGDVEPRVHFASSLAEWYVAGGIPVGTPRTVVVHSPLHVPNSQTEAYPYDAADRDLNVEHCDSGCDGSLALFWRVRLS